MTDRILADTNLLVYAYDRSEPVKQARALATLDRLLSHRRGLLCTQVLSEFYNVVTRKLPMPLTSLDAYANVLKFARGWPVLDLTPLIVLEAARGAHTYQMPIWDAQIWATARLNQVPVVFSEDFNDGSVIEGICFVNPFAGGFQLSDWM